MLHELFPEKFGILFGALLFFRYSGSMAGTVPVVWLIGRIGWLGTLLLPGGIACMLVVWIAGISGGTMQKGLAAQSHKPLSRMLRNGRRYHIFLSTGICSLHDSIFAAGSLPAVRNRQDFAVAAAISQYFPINLQRRIIL